MGRYKAENEMQEKLDSMSVDEAFVYGHPDLHPVVKTKPKKQITIKYHQQLHPRGDLFAWDDANGVFQVKYDYEMSNQEWKDFKRK